jgi:hypothetical protein
MVVLAQKEHRPTSFQKSELAAFINRLQQKYVTYQVYWSRVTRQIEEGTYRRDVVRAKQRIAGSQSRDASSIEVDIDVDYGTDDLADLLEGDDGAGAHGTEVHDTEPPPPPPPSPARAPASPAAAAAPLPPPEPASRPRLSPFALGAPSRSPVPAGPSASIPAPRAHAPAAPPAGIAPPAGAAPSATFSRPKVAPAAPASIPPQKPAGIPLPAGAIKAAPLPPRAAPAPARSAPAAPAPKQASLDDSAARAVYDRYVEARRRNNERVDNLKFETVQKSLADMLPKLREKHAGKKIDFEVVVKDGKVGIKPVAK